MNGSNRIYYMFLSIVGVLVVAGASFFGGITYQKNHGGTATATASNGQTATGQRGFGGAGGRRGGTFGTVSAVSGTTLTIASRTGTNVTISLSGNPTITKSDGTAGALSDIAVGDTVIITGTADSSGTVQATAIRLNPNFGGGAGGAAPQSTTPDDSGSNNSGI